MAYESALYEKKTEKEIETCSLFPFVSLLGFNMTMYFLATVFTCNSKYQVLTNTWAVSLDGVSVFLSICSKPLWISTRKK